MNAPRAEHVILILYAVLLAVGGVLGFVRAQSRASLISGLLSAVAAVVAAVLAWSGYTWGLYLGATLTIVLFLLFGYRYAVRNRKFMPSGMLAVVSLVVLLLLMMMADWRS